ncbi:polysaccharide ABC transporter ATP-binding protein [Geomonas paludis]|uniref:ABC transporter n=1 Tax=Geomonas paludis TaxID=2740185 RepID=A0A6V8MWB0_9BACT|nr:polysaccharide ABC transporter ATP-binding protein [Geomonas paludis]UPU34385.1 polysaccharide ABC transporter ATP-binding protein [Geomonas paludis]GFO64370.1 ABC transporter [Geomonas paludis]
MNSASTCTVIDIKGLGKRYSITRGAPEDRSSLRDALSRSIANVGARLMLRPVPASAPAREEFWALDDVSIGIREGERVGIIGKNGAGKSTLLKILSRITEPTSGSVRIKGRVASLLEVGTGFHPELTGRENIFLNGAILGMNRQEIRRKFDEIVAFSEVEKFLDTPVKRYSSGMYVRLAFAVAAHLEPEILIVDEVLAVGDTQFQKKCLGKMEEVGRQGRTVLFVSHNMIALQSLCDRSIWLDQGRVVDDGDSGAVVARYLQRTSQMVLEQSWDDPASAPGNGQVRLCSARLDCGQTGHATVATPLAVEFTLENDLPGVELNYSMHLYSLDGTCVFNSASRSFIAQRSRVKGVCHIPANLLNAEVYRVKIMVVRDKSLPLFEAKDALVFEVSDVERDGAWFGKWAGVVRPDLAWEIETAAPGDRQL